MTQNVLMAAPQVVPRPLEADRPRASVGTPSTGRLIGIDLARGLAVFGMYAAHVGPDVSVGGPVGFLQELARGRSSALFAVLAGFSLIIIMGRPQPRTGRAGRQAMARIVIRTVVLGVLGYALTALGTSIEVILSFYALLFVVVLPLYRLRTGALTLIAATGAVIMPLALHAIRASIQGGSWAQSVIAHDPLARITGTGGIVELLFTGSYPVLTWAPFLVAGMALARLDLTRPGIRSRMALTGGGLALLGYGGSWLALHLVPHAMTAVASATDGSASAAWWSDTVGEPEGRTPLAWLLVAAPHSQTTFSIVANIGVAVVVVAACLTVAARLPRLTRLATPIASVGKMALTVYVLHIVALWFFTHVWYVAVIQDETMAGLPVLLGFIASAALVATVWARFSRRGPLEQLLHLATRPARYVK